MNWNDKGDYLSRLTYVSRAVGKLGQEQLDEIMEQSSRNNLEQGIYGMLCFYQHYFLQTIEGPRDKINQLLKRLLKDQRHQDMEVIEFSEIEQLNWDRWSMDIASSSQQSEQILKRYLKDTDFNAFYLTNDKAQTLLRELGDQAAGESSAEED